MKKLSQLLKTVDDMIREQRWADCISKLAQVQKVESQEPRFKQIVNKRIELPAAALPANQLLQ